MFNLNVFYVLLFCVFCVVLSVRFVRAILSWYSQTWPALTLFATFFFEHIFYLYYRSISYIIPSFIQSFQEGVIDSWVVLIAI